MDGRTYDTWIVLITLILKTNGLDCGVSHTERTTPSPFVVLITELQEKAINKKRATDNALAKAITRARASIKIPSEFDKKERVKDFVYQCAGATESGGDAAHKWVVDRVLEGRFRGLHPIRPKNISRRLLYEP